MDPTLLAAMCSNEARDYGGDYNKDHDEPPNGRIFIERQYANAMSLVHVSRTFNRDRTVLAIRKLLIKATKGEGAVRQSFRRPLVHRDWYTCQLRGIWSGGKINKAGYLDIIEAGAECYSMENHLGPWGAYTIDLVLQRLYSEVEQLDVSSCCYRINARTPSHTSTGNIMCKRSGC